MFRSFEEIEAFVLRNRRARMRIALAAAQDGPALSALVEAKRKGVARGVLIGKEEEIRSCSRSLARRRRITAFWTVRRTPPAQASPLGSSTAARRML